MKKNDKRVWWSLPILLGIYLIFRQYSKSKSSASSSSKKSTVITSSPDITPSPVEIFPIRIGDIDSGAPSSPVGKVVDLQRLINVKGYIPSSELYSGKSAEQLTEDGIFGPKTQDALNSYINKKSIDNQADLNYLKNMIYPTITQFN